MQGTRVEQIDLLTERRKLDLKVRQFLVLWVITFLLQKYGSPYVQIESLSQVAFFALIAAVVGMGAQAVLERGDLSFI